ncbi:transmembrane E3 ubiquitin-protein ligase FLY1-like isoform X2 [Trifolium pratense]|uniref:transmembrane E3 ubiquitin-protein ligase FLY1-like isoform X2 n=1 Tax=Trifolium pratense TaxID=57577 RepID=UPI001E695914|nr:transmembrane E3 ubiquitin-protein ligase FLY1-like isoform X2 [Trifolium pratense]
MVDFQRLELLLFQRRMWHENLFHVVFGCWVVLFLLCPVSGLRPLRDDQFRLTRKDESVVGPFSEWNITGTYKGTWKFLDTANSSSRFPDTGRTNGNSIITLSSTRTTITGVHYVHGIVIFDDLFDNEHGDGGAQISFEGVYIWPFKQLRMVTNSGKEGELNQYEDYILPNPYRLLAAFSSQTLQAMMHELEKHCNAEISATVSHLPSSKNESEQDHFSLEGLMKSPPVDDGANCLSPLLLNATSVIRIDVDYNKAVYYTLMVTFVSSLQVLLLNRQIMHSGTQSGAAKVSILMIGQQALMDAHFTLLHLTIGMIVESLLIAFATVAFFKFVLFSIFETRYLVAIWKAGSRSLINAEGYEAPRHEMWRELSLLHSCLYGTLLMAGIISMYELHNHMKLILLLMYTFWIPQIIRNVFHDSRKPLDPHYILGITVTRLAIPLYIFGFPNNFMHIEPDKNWCVCLTVFLGLQAVFLLLQHYLGPRWFIPRQMLPEKYNYHRKFDHTKRHATECVICMTDIDLFRRTSDCMVTPCDHFFHSGCLQIWMDIKMECPTCRRALPSA